MSFDTFADRHIGVSNPDELKAMLDTIGVGSVDELIAQVIPQSIRLKKPLDLPAGMSEYEFAAHIRALADRNHPLRSFIGMGYYPCAVPAAVARNVFENPAWYTSYTPYQAEISQGRLEALLNFQTAVLSLTGMEIANCSLLDEGTATAEAMLMMFALRSPSSTATSSRRRSTCCSRAASRSASSSSSTTTTATSSRAKSSALSCSIRPPTAPCATTRPSSKRRTRTMRR